MAFGGNKEALGWAIDTVGRTVMFIATSVYVATTIISLAKKEAGCETEIADESSLKVPECDKRIYGMKPSSLLTTCVTIVSILTAFCLPIVGALIDHTSCRKLVGLISAVLALGLIFLQIFITESNWLFILISLIVLAFVSWIHTLVVFAYLPELTDDADQLVSWTAIFNVVAYVSLLVFLAYMIGFLYIMGYADNVLIQSRVASISSFVISAPCYLYTWTKLMKKREAFHPLPRGSSLSLWKVSTFGFGKVFRTCQDIYHCRRPLLWFFLNTSLVEAASQAIASVSLTYMTDTLQMTSNEIGIAIIILFISSLVGVYIGKRSVSWMTPIQSIMICQIFTAGVTVLAVVILNRPGQSIRSYILASLWGIGAGWKIMIERFTVCQIIPKGGQDAELMGFYLFASQVLAWLPSLIFTVMNEAGVDQRIGLSTLIAWFVLGVICLCFMGPYDEAVRAAQEEETKIDDEEEEEGLGKDKHHEEDKHDNQIEVLSS